MYKKFVIKALFLALYISVIVSIFSVFWAYNVITISIESSANKIYINAFEYEVYGDPDIGDQIRLKANITSISNKKEEVTMVLLLETSTATKVASNRTTKLRAYENKEFTWDFILEVSGHRTYTLNCYVDNKLESSKLQEIKVNSFKDDDKFVVTYFHFNIQFYPGRPELETRIINESIYELLAFYEDYPQYKFSFEIQSYAIERMDEDFPHVLELVEKLTRRGQMELIITHYSQQLYIAFPELDLRRSIELTDKILNEHKLRRSNVFGSQEWQFSPAILTIMEDYNYDIYVGRDRVFRQYSDLDNDTKYRGEALFKTSWKDDSTHIVFDRGAEVKGDNASASIDYVWAHHGDGEAVNTERYGNLFQFVQDKQDRFAEKLEEYEEEGHKFVTISELVYTAKEKNLPIQKIEPILCGCQGSEWLWLGAKIYDHELDVEINTLRYKARTALLALENVVSYADRKGMKTHNYDYQLDELWKELFLAEVSDSTGWYPRIEEVEYAIKKTEYILTQSQKLTNDILHQLDMSEQNVLIYTNTNDVRRDFKLATYETSPTPIDVNITYNNYDLNCYKYADGFYMLEININADDETGNVSFIPYEYERMYTPMSTKKEFNLERFANNTPYLPLSNGWIYLGNNTNLICLNTVRYPAMRFDNISISFVEENVTGEITYRFILYNGDIKSAMDLANHLNAHPMVLSGDISSIVITEKLVSKYL